MKNTPTLPPRREISPASFKVYLRPYIGVILSAKNMDDVIGKYFNLEGASIYINPEGLDSLKDQIEDIKFDDQVISIEHIDEDRYTVGYIITELNGESTVIYDTINSLDEITDDQLDLITLLWPRGVSCFDKVHFRNKLKNACGVGSQESSKQATTHVIRNTVTRVDIDLSDLGNPTPSDTHPGSPV